MLGTTTSLTPPSSPESKTYSSGSSTLPLQPTQDPPLVAQRKQELLIYVQNFYKQSWQWRSTRMHEKWNRCDRNYHAIYDPDRAAQKEPWQSTMFIDVTFQNNEIVCSQIYKTMMAPNPPIQTEAGPAGDPLQARLIQDVVDYELRKGNFKVAFYDALKEAVKYGSGFIKLYWERVEDVRLRRMPVEQTPQEVLQSAPPEALSGQMPMPQPGITGFQMQPMPVLLKNNLCVKYVHIRDIFPEPNTTTWDKVIHRDKISYGTILDFITKGQFFDVRAELQDVREGDKFEEDTRDILQERGYFEVNREQPRNEKRHTVWEMYNMIPRKWVTLDMPDGDDAEVLVPAKVMVASGVALLSTEINAQFDGETPVMKFDYIRSGESYGKGICEILFDDQDEINESGNLGIDNMNLILNKMIAVVETGLVNPDQDIVSKPGGEIRFKSSVEDIRKVFMPIEFPDLAKSFFEHRFNLERMVQEKTGVNRVTLGSSGMVKDSNQTLGGMELLKQMANDRQAAYGMVLEANCLIPVAERVYGLIYQNLDPEALKPILGEEPVPIGVMPGPLGPTPINVPRYMAFAFVPPEVVGHSYMFKPMGIFSLDNKVIKSAQFMDWTRVFQPVVNLPEAAKYAGNLQGMGDEVEKLVMPMPMMPPPPGGGPPGPGGGPPGGGEKPGMRGGPNGNQPNFMPPEAQNPLQRQPVVG